MLKAILFDLDGVLIDSMAFHCSAWQEAFHIFGLAVDPIDVYRMEGMDPHFVATTLFQKRTDILPELNILNNILNAKQRAYLKNFTARLYPGVTKLLEELHLLSLQIAIVTGASDIDKIPEIQRTILTYCDAVVAGGETNGWKPEPKPYLSALEMLAVDARVSCVVENSPSGIESAFRAGIRCLAVQNNSPLPTEELLKAGADWVAPDIAALSEKIRSILYCPSSIPPGSKK